MEYVIEDAAFVGGGMSFPIDKVLISISFVLNVLVDTFHTKGNATKLGNRKTMTPLPPDNP